MSRRAVFVPYRPKTILNKYKRADHWFWTRYSAYPYLGCQHGCEFCYCREQKYSPYDDPTDFAYVIKVKENAPELLRRALSRSPVDVVFTADYQPAERKFGLSRQMLEVCRDLGFPVFVLERSALVLRDMDLLQEINQQAPSVVAFSAISTPDSPNHARVRQLEHLAPPVEKRFAAMEAFAKAGFLTGVSFMPILPGLCDDDANLEAVVRWTADHGGKFVLAGGLTLSDQQKDYFFGVLRQRFPDLLALYQRWYPPASYAPRNYPRHRIALRIRALCQKYGIRDRVPRPILPGDKRALNKRIVERLADRVYEMEIHQEPDYHIWAYRKAAWAIEDLEQNIGLIYQTMGLKGLQSIPNVGPLSGKVVEKMLVELQNNRTT
ncbi:DNA repair photolyase [Longilinea arvoryzae]|uniref:DNA repair photolyase n=1 Tax=Longilinea arvoryzae TaxID=360412 RepID=A0A0S7B5G4_9CHLR|nr:radical SAM protein [Longilinea arvoryzae]GAP12412.1 DNA repair photolyase [Longilinea arvoryzae]